MLNSPPVGWKPTTSNPTPKTASVLEVAEAASAEIIWLSDAENGLKKIPFFVRGIARRNTGKYPSVKGIARISVATLYEAKARYARCKTALETADIVVANLIFIEEHINAIPPELTAARARLDATGSG